MLSIENWVCYRSGRDLFAPISFTLAPGKLLFLRGSNGSGKTTLLRSLTGLFRNYRGRLRWNGKIEAPEESSFYAKLFFLGHREPLKGNLTLKENLDFWASFFVENNERDRRITQALDHFSLAPLAERLVDTLSAGQKRRGALSLLCLRRAPIWLLDEPTTHLDRDTIRDFAILVEAHLRDGGMALIATHDDLPLHDQESLFLDAANHDDESKVT